MDDTVKVLVEISERQFDGQSLLGVSLMGELRTMSVERAASTQTYEGYSVWGIVLHLLYRKYLAARLLGGDPGVEPFPYEKSDWPAVPNRATTSGWVRLLEDLRNMHAAYTRALAEFPMARWNDRLPQWRCTIGDILQYMACHDVYHLAQIRNMARSDSTAP